MFLFLVSCAHTNKNNLVQKKVLEQQEYNSHRKISKLETQLYDLKVQNDILVDALKDKKVQGKHKSEAAPPNQFPKFDELVYDQARKAYEKKDILRLKEAVRILQSNRPESVRLDNIYYWLAQLQYSAGDLNQALFTSNSFLGLKPKSQMVPDMLYLKGQVYESLNLKLQALDVYKNLKNIYPTHSMSAFALDKIKHLSVEHTEEPSK